MLAFERVFEISQYFRAEKSNTTRHLNEFVSVDFEWAYKDNNETMDLCENLIKYVINNLNTDMSTELNLLESNLEVHRNKFDRITYEDVINDLNSLDNKKDFGDDITEHDLVVLSEKHKSFYFITDWPNEIKPGTTNEEMVQNLDFAQTFLEAAMIEAPEDMQGESLIPLLKGDNKKWDRDAVYYHYYEYPSVHMAKRHYGIVNKEFKLAHFYYDVDEWELYDRLKDPQEMNNVYDDPAYKKIVAKLKTELAELRLKYKDSRELDLYYINKYLDK